MRYREGLNIIFMRDNGPRHSIRLRRSRFYLLIIFFLSMPLLVILLSAQCWLLWEENSKLRENVGRFEIDYQSAESRAARLENLQELLKEENISARELLLRQLAKNGQPETISETAPLGMEALPAAQGNDPGDEEFPAIDTGRMKIENVQIRAMRGNNLRIGLDLRNLESDTLINGTVGAVLVTADGERKALSFAPQDAGNFRINRFKRAVMTAHLPKGLNLLDASVLLEVREQNGTMLYQNMFAIQR